MAVTIQPPQPGDLITSQFVKDLLDELVTLDARLTALEGVVPGANGLLAVTQMDPTDVTQGQELRIFGVNFGLPVENTVTFDSGNPVNQFKAGSNDKLLILDVPLGMTLSTDAQLVTVGVSSARGFDSRKITIRKAQATLPSGTLGVVITPPATALAGTVVFTATLTIRSSLDETFNLTPSIPEQPQWATSMVTDATGNTPLPILSGGPNPPPWQIRVGNTAQGQVPVTVQAFIKVVIPQGSTGQKVTARLDMASSRNPNGFTGGFGAFAFTVGDTGPKNQTIGFGSLTATNGNVAGSIATFKVPTNPASALSYSIPKLTKGSYQISITLVGNSNGWAVSLAGHQLLLAKTFVMNADGDDVGENIFVNGQNPSGNATLAVTVITPPPASGNAPTPDELKNATAFGILQMTLSKA